MSPRSAVTLADAAHITKADIFPLEDTYTDMLSARPRDDRQGYFHPSTIGMCGRRNVYEFIREPAIQTIEADDLEIFNMGHAVHGLVQGNLTSIGAFLGAKKIGYEFEAEVRFNKETDELYREYMVGGTTDGILKIWADLWRQHGVIEIKSSNDKNFKALRGPKHEHVLQAHIYAYRFKTPVIWVWYFNKNTSHRRVFPVVYQQALFDEALDRFATWFEQAQAGILPDREEGHYSCSRCEYRNSCKPSVLVNIRTPSGNRGSLATTANLR